MSILKSYFKSAGILTFLSVAQRTFGIVSSIVLVRLLGTTAFGIFNAVINTASMGSGLSRLGADGALHVHMAEKSNPSLGLSKSQILTAGLFIMAGTGLLGSTLVFVSARWFAESLFQKPELTIWLRFSAGIILFQSLSQFCYAALAGLNEFRRYAIVMISSAALNVVLIAIGGYTGALLGTMWATLLLNLLTAAGLFVSLIRSLHARTIGLDVDRLFFASSKILRLGFPFYLSALIGFPATYYLQIYLTRSYGVESLAYLRIITTFTGVIVFIPTSIAAATITILTEVRSDPNSEQGKFLEYALLNIKLVWLFCLIAAASIYTVLPLLIPLLFGQVYLAALPAARIALFSSVLFAVMTASSNVFFSARKVKLILFQTGIFSVVQLAIGFRLIPSWGLVGYVTAEFAGYLIVVLLIVTLLIYEARKEGISISPTLLLLILTLFSLGSTLFMAEYVEDKRLSALGNVGLIIALCFIGYQFLLDAREHHGLNRVILGFWRRVAV